jgi:peptidyl-prolyl cis-trans isomerase SurA
MRKRQFSTIAAAFATLAIAISALISGPAAASEIKYVINDMPITSGDIAHRAAFMRLQHKKGGDAAQDMIEQTLKLAEAKRLGIRISDKQVDAAYVRFATSNKMKTGQLDGIMEKSGVTVEHFKDFIRTQMAWNQALGMRYRSQQGGVSEQDAVRQMLNNGGNKPSATEYLLQQIIFVVPPSERGTAMAKRKSEAQAFRNRFNSCSTTRDFAKGLLDVTVRDLGRVLAPQLPPEWANDIKATKAGGATNIRETDRGVEFIGICSAREVSDDRVAQLVLQDKDQDKGTTDQQADELSKKYLDELRQKARIVQR